MASNSVSKPSTGSSVPAPTSSSSTFRNRRDSIKSVSAASTATADRDQLAHTLDEIHTSASQCDSLTTFNDFAPLPDASQPAEGKVAPGDLVHQGLSGLYSRFREAVGVGASSKPAQDDDHGKHEDPVETPTQELSYSPLPAPVDYSDVETPTPLASQQLGMADLVPVGVSGPSGTRPSHSSQSSRSTGISLLSTAKSQNTSRPSLSKATTSSVPADPTIAAVTVHRDSNINPSTVDDSASQVSSRKSFSRADLQSRLPPVDTKVYDRKDSRQTSKSKRDDASSIDGSVASSMSPAKGRTPSVPPVQTHHVRTPSNTSSMLSPDHVPRRPAVIDRITRSRSPAYTASRASSIDGGTAEPSPINTSAHNSVYHDSFSQESHQEKMRSGNLRIPGTARSQEGASDQMNAQLDRMRKQVLSKEFWMKDDTVKECFLCQTPFTAFRRKHHCRTCGCIFDSKCTTTISGERFGLQGSLRVCKRCLEVISRRFDGSASEDSGDEQSFMPRFFGNGQPKSPNVVTQAKVKDQDAAQGSEGSEDARPVTTPMMAIPATRRVKDSNNRSSAILEIDTPKLSRPGSSRSLKSMTSGRPASSTGHKRHHSKHGILGRFRPPPETQVPFRKGIADEDAKKPKFPAFHDDNIIDPELADYMSDESSGDEQMSIFATMSTSDLPSGSYETEKSNFGPYVTAGRKHRHRAEKSISGMSHISRTGVDDLGGPASLVSHRRPTRRRNMSNVSGGVHYLVSPRPRSGIFKGPSASSEFLLSLDSPHHSGTQLTRSDSLQHQRMDKIELNKSSLKHVDRLLHQLLEDAEVPNPAAWQKALVPILLRSTDDVTPDVAKGEDMDIRHYVKLKRIPGGKPGDTAYVSGVVFTKNLALKSMPRKIMNPRIVLVTFPIEYQRHQQHFMSLQPVIEQEKEFLRVVVQRITNLRPQVLLAEKGVSGVALQYLSEANISVAYNVKHTVIEAVSRCAETEIISSLDMLALPVQVGRCAAFEVRTFVNNDYPGRKKSYIFLSGCKPDLGCTIALRGATSQLLAKVKNIMEFMVYVVYNLKLESSLLRDESIEPPDDGGETSLSNSFQTLSDNLRSSVASVTDGPTVVVNHASSESEPPSQVTVDSSSFGGTDEAGSLHQDHVVERPRLVSLHDSHTHASPEGQVPDDVPMPTYYSDTVAKYETKIVSASPYVKFTQPYLLMRAREQERRLFYLRRLRDHDIVEDKDDAKSAPQKFQLIKPEMVEKIGQKGPRQMMEILHAVHDAEYDKALFNYQTQTRQWETYIQGNLDLFDPYSHQNIVVLYSVICTETKIPCIEPGLVAINFYDEQHVDTGMDPDCTLGQYIEHLVYSKDDICTSNGCERKELEHHRTYVHDEARVTVVVEHVPNATQRRSELGDGITMWTYCKICKKDSEEKAMSEATFKYSFGKYLELLYWGRGLRMKNNVDCPHDHHRDHVRYFSLQDARIRIHWDPIDLLEIVVPRARITWKVANDLRLKNGIFTRMEERWVKFMTSIKSRLKSIRIDSVLPEKAESCKAQVEQMTKQAQEDQVAIIRRLQETYVQSKYYEVVPFNKVVREMLEKASAWDQAFAEFEAEFLGDKDMRQLTIMQLKKMFTDNESKESLTSNEGITPTDATASTVDSEERPSQTLSEAEDKTTQPTDYTEPSLEASTASTKPMEEPATVEGEGKVETEGRVAGEEKVEVPVDGVLQRIEPLDLATSSPSEDVTPSTVNEAPPNLATFPSVDEKEPSSSPEQSVSPNGTIQSTPDAPTPVSGQSLSEKVEQLRREQGIRMSHVNATDSNTSSQDAALPDQTGRKAGSSVSPPLARAISQPARPLPRSHSSLGLGKPLGMRDAKAIPNLADTSKEQLLEGSMKVDKKLSDRLGLGSLKNRGKMSTSSIPRLVSRKKESKVSTLARHFEQLSREFERERIRDRKQRAANLRQPRPMLTKATTRAIVQVYDNVNEAFEEQMPSSEQALGREPDHKPEASQQTKTQEELGKPQTETQPADVVTPVEPPSQPDDTCSRSEQDETTIATTSQGPSEDEGADSDLEPSVSDDYLPDIKEIADSLEPSADIPLELPKHQKTSLMKYLTNFWAERSASGWPQLEYPVNPTDHIFVDSDVIVREDEPSSVIALALSSDDYQNKLANIRKGAQDVMQRAGEDENKMEPTSVPTSDNVDWLGDEAELEKSLLRVTGTHLKYQFKEGQAVMTCKIFYAEQFDALRRKCGVAERIIESLSRCLKWDSKGGKTKSVFLKTLDDRLVLKSLSPIETSAFLRFAPGYFSIMAEALFHELPSVIAKMLGFFQVLIKNPVTGTDVKLDLLVTENLFYDRSPSRIFDLKGSMRNRKIQSTGEQNEVLLDENMVEFIYESPLFAREHSKKLLRASVWNDTLFLARQDVMDYSLMIAVDEARKELVVGIIDCIRTYTWDKKLESWIKDRGFAGGGRNRPTVTSPKEYKSRFREAMARYILQAPNCWHLFHNPQLPNHSGRARFEEPDMTR
ncbi:1-phosphatidylinositol 3-phosphate 5-kinase fab1 [Paramyrothecium foliicola]|nr:1-phosphatidylinositol 3-phosphate 5-kinase fab1 [Paramyrothecium foliicola]